MPSGKHTRAHLDGRQGQCSQARGRKKKRLQNIKKKEKKNFKNTACKNLQIPLSYNITAGLFSVFCPTELVNAWKSLTELGFTTGAIVQASLHALSGILCALAMQSALYGYREETNLYSVTKLFCLLTNKLALAVTSSGGKGSGGGKR